MAAQRVKPSLQYHGGHVFGRAKNNSDILGNAVLSNMIKCLHGGPKFLVKIIVAKFTSEFLYDKVTKIINIVNSGNRHVVAIITDNT